MDLTLESRLALSRHARFRRFDGEGVVVNQESAEALVLNDVGAKVVECADGKSTLGDCVRAIAAEYEADRDSIERDVLRFANELVGAGVAVVVEP